jgi:hypothetical protein
LGSDINAACGQLRNDLLKMWGTVWMCSLIQIRV